MNLNTPVGSIVLNPLESGLLTAHKEYCDAVILLDAHFLDIIRSYSASDITGYGTGRDEVVTSLESLVEVAVRSKEQAPGNPNYHFNRMNVRVMGNTGVVDGIVAISFDIDGENTTMDVRLSVVYEYFDNKWKAVHLHSSLPSSEQALGESFPLNALKAKNEELQRLVEEKTAVLQQKNRELEIEAALERVRAEMMSMHKSEELRQVISSVFKELQNLGFDAPACALIIYNKDLSAEHWMSGFSQDLYPESYKIPYNEHPYFTHLLHAWQQGALFEEFFFEGDLKTGYAEWLFEHSDFKRLPQEFKNEVKSPTRTVISDAFMRYGMLEVISAKSLPEEKEQIVKRFAKVFEQTYTRFLDLQKAEAQAREAQIEAALEKVRSRSLAMHHSNELQEVVTIVFEKFKELNISMEGRAAVIVILTEGSKDMDQWVISPDLLTASFYKVPYHDDLFFNLFQQAKEDRKEFFAKAYSVDQNREIWKYNFEYTDFRKMPDDLKNAILQSEHYAWEAAIQKHSAIGIGNFTGILLSPNEIELLKRFLRVFEQSYIRFLDLQKAEAQATEAKIEAALERVRSRSLAMHRSNELQDVVQVVFEKLDELGFGMGYVSINTFDDDLKETGTWAADAQQSFTICLKGPYNEYPPFKNIYDAREEGVGYLAKVYQREEKDAYWNFLFNKTNFKDTPDTIKRYILESECYAYSIAIAKHSFLMVPDFTGKLISEDQKEVLIRFSRVFEQAYIRFLDLHKAEAQAREAKIEASLERVRSKTMAMHKTADIGETISAMFDELLKLGVENSARSGVIIYGDAYEMELWNVGADEKGKVVFVTKFDVRIHPLLLEGYNKWKGKASSFSYVFAGEDLKVFYEALNSLPNYPVKFDLEQLPEKRISNSFYFQEGALYVFTDEPLKADAEQLFKRFTSVFGLTYRRFCDLQKAEASAKEAMRQASLDRVRAEIASMRTTSDLERITPLIWNELTILNVPFIRCGVFIVDEKEKQINVYLSTPDGKAIASFQLPLNTEGFIQNVLVNWRNNQTYINHWDAAAFSAWTKSLVEQKLIKSDEKYNTEIPPENLYLHFLPFLQGLVYVGNTTQLSEGEMKLAQYLADAFSTAYARYEDFNNLENAKQQIEKTLSELKATQTQLIQKEKMASLGELTAGVAHEIQNPLNFVNNFSDVNKELVDELQDELKAGNTDEAFSISNEIKENEQKINHHGKRADAIVKGMLQHSRASSGKKEPTEINALADEYLRLSYHGLRAKDKDFNADFTTDFDKSIAEIDIVPQDIGRVLLNLYNNAFYAVSERKRQLNGQFKPTVTVSTKRADDKIEVSIKDNGTGIPQKAVDKIFQPFFTTKPTGQGTGLGLSLSYDIIKAHGGELRVETVEGGGAVFVIQLPFTENSKKTSL